MERFSLSRKRNRIALVGGLSASNDTERFVACQRCHEGVPLYSGKLDTGIAADSLL